MRLAAAMAFAFIPMAASAAPCQGGEAAVEAALTSADPLSEAVALSWSACDDSIARELAVLRLADDTALTPQAASVLIDRLGDPAQSVRFAAVKGVLAHAEQLRPMLLAKIDGNGRTGDTAAAALALIGTSGLDLSALRNTGKGAIMRRAAILRAAGAPGAFEEPLPGSINRESISATDVAQRIAAAEQFCGAALDEIPLDPAGLAECEDLSSRDRGVVALTRLTASKRAEQRAFEALLTWLSSERTDAPYREFGKTELSSAASTPGTGVPSKSPVILLPPASRPAAGKPQPPKGAPPAAAAAYGDPTRGTQRLPKFPWPAPRPMKQQQIPAQVVGGANATLDQVVARLQRGLQQASDGYEWGLFSGPPNGFVLLTRLERIRQDGAPFDESRRFTEQGSPKASFLDMLNSLMGERPGYFRAIAFVVTDNLQTNASVPVSAIPLDRLGEAIALPSSLGKSKLGKRQVYALVYAFERPPGKPRRAWVAGAPTALQHLQASGIARALKLR